MKMRMFLIMSLALILVPLFSPGAETKSKDEILQEAEAAWMKRANLQYTLRAVDLFEQAAALDPKDIRSRLLLAEAAYWAVEQSPEMDRKKKIELLRRGIRATEEVLDIDPENTGAYNWRMWDMAAITVAEGILRGGYAFKEAIVGTIMVSRGDISYYYGAIYTYWARVIYTLPGILGKFFHFTEDDAVWLYQQALEVEPDFYKTRFYLAESYLKKEDIKRAKAEFRYIVETPASSLEEREPENEFYQAEVKRLYSRFLETEPGTE
jgi:tetratricopeptide (TPR) repeat protein